VRQRYGLAAVIAAALVCLTGPGAAASSTLLIDIVFDGYAMSQRIETSAIEETARIWAPYGVDVGATVSGEERDGAVRLLVVLDERPSTRLAGEPLGSIRFVDAVPEHRIVIHLGVIDTLLASQKFLGLGQSEWPLALHEALFGRVLGRALAHEIGHFLLRSRTHSSGGLMRPVHVVPDLMSSDRRHFRLSPREAAFVASESLRE
jgi:hypothetical protein